MRFSQEEGIRRPSRPPEVNEFSLIGAIRFESLVFLDLGKSWDPVDECALCE
jgi:hypothetical protein